MERGGQLFVNPVDPKGLLLALATLPHRADRSGWSWLELDAARCRQEIQAANEQGLRLVGYWHTHPQSVPVISPADIGSFSKFAARYTQDLPHPIAIIVGKSENQKVSRRGRSGTADMLRQPGSDELQVSAVEGRSAFIVTR